MTGHNLDPFFEGLYTDAAIEEISQKLSLSPEYASKQLLTYLTESNMGFRKVLPQIEIGQRILEVGGGVGATALALHREGHDVTDLEPVGLGFDFMQAARNAIRHLDAPPEYAIGVDELDASQHGRFDFIYSMNVLEHVPDPENALSRMQSVLEPFGKIFILCPNYSFPFEPHINVPLIPFKPAATARLLPRRVSQSDIWKSLNWITARRILRWAEKNNAEIHLHESTMAEMFERATNDNVFAQRHRVLSRGVSLMDRAGLSRVLARLPAKYLSPMQITITSSHS